ncbi:hypothetical protein HPB47_008857 [Ixodes persulcatus]|uniref:Uncharacterized protein n=1 Tax=Ixodes persulcatus TaxID=34615 RepID=A0AC60P3K3_IXOPE|nr:hypothetical protein HPB47_008857 [Ixodes persulcatus]
MFAQVVQRGLVLPKSANSVTCTFPTKACGDTHMFFRPQFSSAFSLLCVAWPTFQWRAFKTGGMLWFTDLTIPDPYCLLPLITSATLFFTIELGAESGVRADNLQWTRYVFRAMPIVIFPFTMNFPAALLCYWATSNMVSLVQVGLLRVGAVREALNMPALVKHKKSDLVLSKKSFMEGVKDSFTNARITRELEDRVRADEMRFKKAGMGPVVKTYPYNPTKQAFAKGAEDGRKIND